MISLESSRIIQRTECDQPERFVYTCSFSNLSMHVLYDIVFIKLTDLQFYICINSFFLKMLYSIVENWLEFSVNLDFISIYTFQVIPMLFKLLTYLIYKNAMDNNNNV